MKDINKTILQLEEQLNRYLKTLRKSGPLATTIKGLFMQTFPDYLIDDIKNFQSKVTRVIQKNTEEFQESLSKSYLQVLAAHVSQKVIHPHVFL